MGVGSSFSLLRTLPVYWLTIALAAAFPVLCLLAIQGLAANLLPRQIFLRLSAFLQAGLLCLLMTNYFLGPSFNSPAALLAPANQHTLHLLPGYWFLGLFNQLNGSLQPELVPLAHRAWAALGIAAAGAVAALLLSYLRMLPRIVEQPEIVPAMRSRSLPLGNSLASVVTLFSLRTLTRSRLHRMILSVYLGIGLTIIFGFLHTRFANTGLRFAEGHTQPLPLSLTYLLSSILTIALTALALRIVVGIPITLRANWIFRATQVRPAWRYHHATRLSFFTLATAPAVLLLLGAGLLRGRGTILAVAEHLAIMALFGALLVELCLFTFRKIAFACSYLPGKANLHFAFWIALFASIEWIRDAAGYEGRTLTHPSNTTLLLLGLAAAATLIHALSNQHSRRTADLLFEEEDLTAMVTLNLR
ncbi:MAG: hypothetical protein PW789_04680 [Edaphobacter sp.]|uniref:hypothetical protein n=1 Tax=Edaphobacter sp. TaxID=1934404 RepID=UPI0023A68D89|nr:hypothetical protein [Edaphobacter sp.]MDE1175882.1 hypothetical protein [Edaphobacter sp.]